MPSGGQIATAGMLSIAEPITGNLSGSALTDGQDAATINPITDPYGITTPFGLWITGHVLATIVTTERWDLLIECPINTEVARIRGIEEAATQMWHPFSVYVPNATGASTSVRFIADRIAGSGTWQASALPVYNQYAINFNRLP